MNPHRLAWGFAYHFPFSQVVALVTIVAMFVSTDPKRIPWFGLTVVWLLFVVWLNVSTLFAIDAEISLPMWERVMKIQLIAWITLILINDFQRLRYLVWVIVLSLGFFGVKGGLFSIATGGNYLVMGPAESMIPENNTLAVALLMTLPLYRFLQMHYPQKWFKLGMMGAIGLTLLAVLTSHSRGALVAVGAMGLFLLLRSPHRFRIGIVLVVALPLMFSFMPDKWHERMGTIRTFDQDESALSRLNSWEFAYNLALERPLVGGGFNTFVEPLFKIYAPNPNKVEDSHSIYFEVLGEHGFVGLALFLALGFMTFRMCSWVMMRTRDRSDLKWAHDLTSMLQLSVIAYASGGAFLGLAYYDLVYHIVGMTIITRSLVQKALAEEAVTAGAVPVRTAGPPHEEAGTPEPKPGA